MEFINSFAMPVSIEDAFDILTDMERIAPCMPGAQLEDVNDGVYSGRVKVKLGPMSLSYKGTARLVEQDAANHTAHIVANGNETRGGGTASADVRAVLTDAGDTTHVTVTTKIDITGRPAQFGRGVLSEVGKSIIDQFATNLEAQLVAPAAVDHRDAGPGTTPSSTADAGAGDAALDLTHLATHMLRQRAKPILAGVAVLILLVRLLRRR